VGAPTVPLSEVEFKSLSPLHNFDEVLV
jgi:hypothetical protein